MCSKYTQNDKPHVDKRNQQVHLHEGNTILLSYIVRISYKDKAIHGYGQPTYMIEKE